jgi:conjugative relaxase-like TrwC/TraI family protein
VRNAVAFNATFDPVEERWKAGEFSSLMAQKGYYQAAFHSRLAERLADLGYSIERDGNSFRLIGIDPATSKKFSRRTDVIEAEAERLGITDAAIKGQLGQRTREAKDAEGVSMSTLQEEWRKRLATDNLRPAANQGRSGIKRVMSAGVKIGHRTPRERCFAAE